MKADPGIHLVWLPDAGVYAEVDDPRTLEGGRHWWSVGEVEDVIGCCPSNMTINGGPLAELWERESS